MTDVTMLEKAEAADREAAEAMDRYVIVKSAIYTSGECDPREPRRPPDARGKLHLMGHDPRLRVLHLGMSPFARLIMVAATCAARDGLSPMM
ncbi:MAG TPA: hypothetical protein VFB75_23975 [Burkholderiales bacterium]|nr:hypothetical protein [Burkholderiales bacterium]